MCLCAQLDGNVVPLEEQRTSGGTKHLNLKEGRQVAWWQWEGVMGRTWTVVRSVGDLTHNEPPGAIAILASSSL